MTTTYPSFLGKFHFSKLGLVLGLVFFSHSVIGQGVINNGAMIVLTSGSTVYVDGGTAGNFTNQDNGAFIGKIKNSGTVRVSGDWTNNSAAFVFHANSGAVVLIGGNQAIKGTGSTYFNDLTLLGTGIKTLEVNTLVGGGFANPTGVLALNDLPLDLNARSLLINNPGITAVTRTSGFIISETNASTNASVVEWNAGSTNGTYVFPFGLLTAPHYIPLTISKTSGSTSMKASTRATAASNNMPWQSSVNTMYSYVTGNSVETTGVIDRWYDISSATTFTGTVDFTYRGVENTTTIAPTGTLGAQNWSGTGWLPIVGSGSGVTNGTAVVSIPNQTLGGTNATPWVLNSTGATLFVEELTDDALLVYPNPASNMISVSFPDSKNGQDIMVNIYDESGRLIVQETLQSTNQTISTRSLQTGIYHLTILSKDLVFTRKIVICN